MLISFFLIWRIIMESFVLYKKCVFFLFCFFLFCLIGQGGLTLFKWSCSLCDIFPRNGRSLTSLRNEEVGRRRRRSKSHDKPLFFLYFFYSLSFYCAFLSSISLSPQHSFSFDIHIHSPTSTLLLLLFHSLATILSINPSSLVSPFPKNK